MSAPRPVIGVVAFTVAGQPADRPTAGVHRRYVDALLRAGALPWVIPPAADDPDALAAIADRLDGLLLAGGPDVDTSHYGAVRQPTCGSPDPDRDAAELLVVRQAAARNLPVLGVCRGMQLLNVAHGGTLHQDIASEVPAALRHDAGPGTPRSAVGHDVAVAAGSRLRAVFGDPVVAVNTLHHQAVKELGSGLRPTALAPDGVIEGVEGADDRWLVGVQWHPEELVDDHPAQRRLFAAFVAACG